MKQNKYDLMEEVILQVTKYGKCAELNCNGNIFTIYLNDNNEFIIVNPLRNVIGNKFIDFFHLFNNTVIDSIEYFDDITI
jgi:hypothetical protein